MKKLISGVAIALVAVAFGGETLTTTYGVMKISSSSEEVVIAVPFCGAKGEAMSPSNIVLTANLTVGDELYYYNGSSYDCWQLTEATSGVRYWASVNQVSAQAASLSVNPGTQTLAAGDALVLKRQNASTVPDFYLIGQVLDSATAPTTTITANAKSLVAPPMTGTNAKSTINLNTDVTWANVGSSDIIWVPSGMALKSYRYKNNAWTAGFGKRPEVPVGQGFWYESKGGSPTITWATPASSAE